jgi:predicted nuclease with TOPRIM domain
VQEAEKALIKGLTIEKKHLEAGLEENIALKE